jgi:tRNA threonylcarbamoyladenosine biosynthesis protein TsaB
MRVLALDTTTRPGSVAVIEDGRVIVDAPGDATRSHAERLPGEITDALASAGLATADIDLFAVACGPGSFTGLRIGIATIQGLAFVHGTRVAAISALRALGEAAAAGRSEGTLVGAWMDAHRGDVFTALYRIEQPAAAEVARLVELEEPMVSAPEATLVRWRGLGVPRAICGDGASKYGELLPSSIVVVEAPPLAGVIGRLALAAARDELTVAPAGIQPLYVRRPDAELAWEAAGRR